MNPHIVIIDTLYDGFLCDFQARNPGLFDAPYEFQHAALAAEHFGTGDGCAAALRRLGCRAHTIFMNAEPLQRCWASENGLAGAATRTDWMSATLLAQIEAMQPDVVFVQELSAAKDDLIGEIKPHTRLIVGQIACSLPARRTFASHDLILSSWPPIVEHFRRRGKPAEFCPLGFDENVLSALGETRRRFEVTFVGGLSHVHGRRIELLEHLCRNVPIEVFGYGIESLPADSPIHLRHKGPAWGIDACRIMASSAITVNVHGEIAVPGHPSDHLANNMRLFEATGAGTMLLTDWKPNLSQLFAPSADVGVYRDKDECVERIRYYLEHEPVRRDVAAAGQRRTLCQHTQAHRMNRLLDILSDRMIHVAECSAAS